MHDMVFLHPPVSFKKIDHPLGGIFESGTGTTDLLTMMPIGLISLANQLHARGLDALVVNVAKMTQQIRREPRALDLIERSLEGFPARVHGIGLHWAAHASGAMELARMIKRLHPGSVVVLGGLTASYFTEEILENYPFIDAVVQGECDGHIEEIFTGLAGGRPQDCPNLAYRRNGSMTRTEVRPPDLGAVDYVDSHGLVRPEVRAGQHEREGILCHIAVVHGCSMECLFCGGCRSAYRNFFHRPRTEVVPVRTVLDHVRRSLDRGIGLGGIKLFGDIRLGGKAYCSELREGFESLGLDLDLLLELFWPADREFLEPWRKISRDLYVSFCPESCHREMRGPHGKEFDNDELLDQIRLYHELGIIAWLGFIYPLPGHTRENLMQEVDFLEKILQIEPNASTMVQPYLFMDPGAPYFEDPERYGFTNHMSSLADIIEGLERAYWFHAIGYSTAHLSRHDLHRAILEVTMKKANLYFRSGRLAGRDLLKTYENVRCNRKLGEMIEGQPSMTDEEIDRAIDEIYPEYLRRSNTNLIIRPFFGASFDQSSGPEAMIFDAFPSVLELRLDHDPDAVDDVFMELKGWMEENRERLQDYHDSPALPPQLETLVASLLEPLSLPVDFVRDIASFEWDVYRLLFFDPPAVAGGSWRGRILKSYMHDMTSLDEVLESVRNGGPVAKETQYLIDTKSRKVLSMNVDPSKVDGRLRGVTIRSMSSLGRRIIRAEHTVKVVLSRISGNAHPLEPEVLCDGRDISPSELESIIGTKE